MSDDTGELKACRCGKLPRVNVLAVPNPTHCTVECLDCKILTQHLPRAEAFEAWNRCFSAVTPLGATEAGELREIAETEIAERLYLEQFPVEQRPFAQAWTYIGAAEQLLFKRMAGYVAALHRVAKAKPAPSVDAPKPAESPALEKLIKDYCDYYDEKYDNISDERPAIDPLIAAARKEAASRSSVTPVTNVSKKINDLHLDMKLCENEPFRTALSLAQTFSKWVKQHEIADGIFWGVGMVERHVAAQRTTSVGMDVHACAASIHPEYSDEWFNNLTPKMQERHEEAYMQACEERKRIVAILERHLSQGGEVRNAVLDEAERAAYQVEVPSTDWQRGSGDAYRVKKEIMEAICKLKTQHPDAGGGGK